MSTMNPTAIDGAPTVTPSGESIPGAAFEIADLDRDIVLPKQHRSRLPLLTGVLALSVALGAGVVGGIQIDRHWGSTSSGSGSSSSAAAFVRPSGASTGTSTVAGSSGGGFPGFSGTSGTVKAIDGSTLYVTDATGNVIKVTTKAGVTVTVTKAGTLTDVKPGDTVVVRGTTSSGAVAAESISIGGGGGAGLGG
jgi:hypothetical protein